ncbi:hypothetical protein ACQKWADRAFT_288190 [Trichoderma austrokoningii]
MAQGLLGAAYLMALKQVASTLCISHLVAVWVSIPFYLLSTVFVRRALMLSSATKRTRGLKKVVAHAIKFNFASLQGLVQSWSFALLYITITYLPKV